MSQSIYEQKLIGKIYGLLCEFEKEGSNWEKFLDSILIELMGFEEEKKTSYYYILFYKLSSLRYLRHEYFRTTVFDCMNLVGK